MAKWENHEGLVGMSRGCREKRAKKRVETSLRLGEPNRTVALFEAPVRCLDGNEMVVLSL